LEQAEHAAWLGQRPDLNVTSQGPRPHDCQGLIQIRGLDDSEARDAFSLGRERPVLDDPTAFEKADGQVHVVSTLVNRSKLTSKKRTS
jgi:hypothetical protein